ncbi:MAG TPA: hypothetical protein VF791_15435 [Pyrinomonadaceae bacterium]
MRSRVAIVILLAALVGLIVISTAVLRARSDQTTQQLGDSRIPIVTNQLPSESGVIPVELKCEDAELSAPNALKKLSCVIKNNTDKHIAAAAMNISITLEKEGQTSIDSSFLTIETLVHPDFRSEYRNNLIPPKGERPFQDLPTNYGDAVIKGVTIRVDYVEFTDNSTAGLNQAGLRIITNIREGAVKYKEWLIRKYNQSGNSINAIVPLLEKDQPIPHDLDIRNGDQQQGVIFYRNYARKTYKTKGAEGLIKHLKQPSTSVNK